MKSIRFPIKQLSALLLLGGLVSPIAAFAIESPSNGGSVRDQRLAEVRADERVYDGGPCQPEILEEIIAKNTEYRNTIATQAASIPRPTKTDSLDCFSSLMDASYGFNIPPLGQMAKSVLGQLKDAACRIAVDKSNQLLDASGLNFDQDLGGEFYIPGTNERIDVDAGNVNTDVGGGLRSNTSGGSNSGITGKASSSASKGGGVSSSGSVSGSRSAGSDDLDSFLNGIF